MGTTVWGLGVILFYYFIVLKVCVSKCVTYPECTSLASAENDKRPQMKDVLLRWAEMLQCTVGGEQALLTRHFFCVVSLSVCWRCCGCVLNAAVLLTTRRCWRWLLDVVIGWRWQPRGSASHVFLPKQTTRLAAVAKLGAVVACWI